jgi:hypothetical protein
MAQVVELLLCKSKALNSNPNPTKYIELLIGNVYACVCYKII